MVRFLNDLTGAALFLKTRPSRLKLLVEKQWMGVQAHSFIEAQSFTAALKIQLFCVTHLGSRGKEMSCIFCDLFLIGEVDA